MQQKKLEKDCVANLEKLRYSILLLANIQMLKIRKGDPDPYFLDKKSNYMFLNDSIKTKILIVYAN